jgi:hypothetical protein
VFADGRGTKEIAGQLTGFSGILQVDGYAAYKALARGHGGAIQLAFCLAHARRKFVEVYKTTQSPFAREVIECLQAVYAIEAEIRGSFAPLPTPVEQPPVGREHDVLGLYRGISPAAAGNGIFGTGVDDFGSKVEIARQQRHDAIAHAFGKSGEAGDVDEHHGQLLDGAAGLGLDTPWGIYNGARRPGEVSHSLM